MLNKRLLHLFMGLVLYSFGIVLTIQGNLGLAPWDALHMGLTYITKFSFGLISILVGLLILLFTYQLDESIGIGTISNIIVIGLLIDLIFALKLIPLSTSTFSGIPMILIGMEMIALGSYFYIGSGFGTGPRDGLMVAITRVTNKPIGLIRGIIEISVLVIGFLLGAKLGIGTILIAFGMGPIIQMTFKFLKFDVSTVMHNALLHKTKNKNI